MSAAAAINQKKDHSDQILVLTFVAETPAGPIRCGLNIHKVREVIETGHLSPLPKDYAPFVAVHDLRGVPVPVMPLIQVFNRQKDPEPVHGGRILIVEIQNKTIGVHVAATGRIRAFRNSEVLVPPTALEQMKSRFFNGVINTDQGYVYMLDIEEILDSFGITLDRSGHSQAEKPVFEGKRVLVVEDSKLYQKKIAQFFTAWGCVLEFAGNGQEALETLKKRSYGFDLIFSDIEMPVMNGIEFATRIKSMPEANRIPLVFNSSLSNSALIEEITREGLGSYIVKFDQEAIRERLSKLL